MKKAQASVAAVVLLVIVLILVLITIVVILLQPYISFKITNPNAQELKTKEAVKQESYEITCNPPYIKVGISCCLDQNYNRICDSEEKTIETETEKYETCYPPYIKRAGSCCLDENENGICDSDDYYNDNYNQDNTRVISKDIDSPFAISSVDVTKDELSFSLKNEGDVDVVITKITEDDCDSKKYNKAIPIDSKKSFSLDCDFGYGISTGDLEVEYQESGSNVTQTSSGTIKVEIQRPSNYCNPRYENC